MRYEICVRNDDNSWAIVDVKIFRSWSGQRRVTGRDGIVRPYDGPVYLWAQRIDVKVDRALAVRR